MKRNTTVLLDEKRIFKPTVETVERAHVKNWENEIRKGKNFKTLTGFRNGTKF
jgi:acetyl-CoA synthetase